MTDQTDDEMRIAIATAVGPWTFEPEGNEFQAQQYVVIKEAGETRMRFFPSEPEQITSCLDLAGVPDYLNSLDAMHEAEQTLSDEERDAYYLTLLDICCDFPGTHTYSATASQRAQAFVRTIAARAEREAKV